MTEAYLSPQGVYDEAFADNSLRPHWAEVLKKLDALGTKELRARSAQASHLLDENGVTYGAPFEAGVPQRPWQLDLIPMLLDEATWKSIEQGIDQRARILNLLIQDIYGEQTTLKQGVLPPEAIFAHAGYLHAARGLHVHERSLVFYAAELARSQDGTFWVMADRSNAPAGMGFSLENRIVTLRVLPQVSHAVNFRKLSPFFSRLKSTLKSLSPRNTEHPRIVLLSGGPASPYYFEDVYLARYLGYDLAQGSDLAVREDQLYLKTLAGLIGVDVLLVRGDEGEIDPLECGGGAPHGVPGLLQAIRAGNVFAANVPGSGVIEAPVFMALLPTLSQHFLDESLKIPSIATWWCQNDESRQYVFDHLQSLVIKPAFRASGGEELIAAHLSAAELNVLRTRIAEKPYNFVAQELIARSAAPSLDETGRLCPGHVAMRVFSVGSGANYSVMPGGLIRVAHTPEPMELSISGGTTSKDLWILSSQPDQAPSLIPAKRHNVELKRTTAKFPSRVADDLFWLGQAIDRSDLLARLLRALLARLDDVGELDVDEVTLLVQSLEAVGAMTGVPRVSEFRAALPNLPAGIHAALGDTTQSRSLAQSVSELLRLSSLVRDWISAETWQQLHHSATEFFENCSSLREPSRIVEVLDELILCLASGTGLIDNGMIRGPAWRFLDLGRRIERARTTSAFARSILESEHRSEPSILKMVIEFCDCKMTYRARYLDDIQQNAVFDLCITDVTNPRSILSQLELISAHVDELPSATPEPLRHDEKRLTMSAVHQVRMLTSEDLGHTEPEQLYGVLRHVETSMRELADLLERKYLLHSGTPRQITTGEVVS